MPEEAQSLIELLTTFGINLIFLVMFMEERKRNREINELRFQEQKECRDLLMRELSRKENQP